MHQTGQIYRPPSEASVQRLEVTIGCSHNKCSFCTMYRKTPFRVALLEDVEADLKELHDRGEKITRIYLTNGESANFECLQTCENCGINPSVSAESGSTYLLRIHSESEGKVIRRIEVIEKCRLR